jgi:hypothetical protein
MGFIKNADGDQDCVIEHVFDNVDEVLDEIVEHTDLGELPEVVEIPGAELLSDGDKN